jgi:hypothetical protein
VERQRPVPLFWEDVKLDCGFRADLVVDGKIVVELKCKGALHPVDEAQLLSHMRLLDIPLGLLINFHVVLLRDGIKRMVNNYAVMQEETGLHTGVRYRSNEARERSQRNYLQVLERDFSGLRAVPSLTNRI